MQLNLTRHILNNYDLATRGAIISMLLLLKEKDGHTRNDDVVIAKMLNLQIRTWRKMKATLIEDKIIFVDGDDIKSNMLDVNKLTNEHDATEFTPNFTPNFVPITYHLEVSPKLYHKHCSPSQEINNATNAHEMNNVSEDQVDADVAGDCLNSPRATKDENSEIDDKERKSLTKRKKSKPQGLYNPLKRVYNTKGFPISAPPRTREEALREPVPLHVEVEAWFMQQKCCTGLSEIEVDDLKELDDSFTNHYAAQGWRTPSGAKITDRAAKFKQWIQRANVHRKNVQLRTGEQTKTDYEKFI